MSDPQHVGRPSDDDAQIQRSGWWVGLLCACALGPTGWQLVLKILPEHRTLNEAAIQAMFQVFILTGPLVLSVGLTTVILLRKWIDPETPAVVFVPALILLGSLLLSNFASFGIGPVKPEEILPYSGGLATAFAFIVNILFGLCKSVRVRVIHCLDRFGGVSRILDREKDAFVRNTY